MVRAGLLVAALVTEDAAQVPRGVGLAAPVADLAGERELPLE